jgi:hypothetical protein
MRRLVFSPRDPKIDFIPLPNCACWFDAFVPVQAAKENKGFVYLPKTGLRARTARRWMHGGERQGAEQGGGWIPGGGSSWRARRRL